MRYAVTGEAPISLRHSVKQKKANTMTGDLMSAAQDEAGRLLRVRIPVYLTAESDFT